MSVKRLGLWAPSNADRERFPRRFSRAMGFAAAQGIEIVTVPSSLRQDDWLAVDQRKAIAADLARLVVDEAVDAVMCEVGGLTALGLLNHLPYDALRGHEVPIIGYSDMSCILLALYQQGYGACWYGPMFLSELGEHGGPFEETWREFRKTLDHPRDRRSILAATQFTDESLFWDRDDGRRRQLGDATPPQVFGAQDGIYTGRIVAGCLPSLLSLLGTGFLPSMEGAILMLEDHAVGARELYRRLQWDPLESTCRHASLSIL